MIEDKLLNLLAIIHRDGGHYTDEHGVDKSIEEAENLLTKYYLPVVQEMEVDKWLEENYYE
jgi:hypothetical protein